MDENNVGVPGAKIILRFLQGGTWVDIMTAYTRGDGMFGLTHESSAVNLASYQISSFDVANFEHFDMPPQISAPDLWRQTQKAESSQTVETIRSTESTDFPMVVTFYQRLKVFEYRPTQFASLYADAQTPQVKATLLPYTSFRYKILGREGKRTHILVNVAAEQFIPAKSGLVNPEKPDDIKDATFGLARMPIYVVAIDRAHLHCGWIDGYLDN
jgi:hypothetical protein